VRINLNFFVIFFLTLGGLAPSAAAAEQKQKPGQPKLDRALRELNSQSSSAPVPVIITATGDCPALGGWLEAHAQTRDQHPDIQAVSADIDARDLDSLSDVSCVKSVSFDAPVGAHAVTTVPAMTLDMVRSAVGSDQIGYTGSGIGVAVIDSGITNSPDLHDRIKAFYDFTRSGQQAPAFDDFGHGSHIAATIASVGKQNGYLWKGIAPSVKLIGLKVLDKNGKGTTSNVIKAITFATANKAALGIDVINLSLGHPIYESAATDPLVQAVERAVRAGIVVVASAGNYGTNPNTGLVGYAGITSPGNAPSAITVGAARTFGTTDRSDDAVAPYSSRGPSWYDGFAKPDVVAPGDRIVADTSNGTLYNTLTQLRVAALPGMSGLYMRLTGSSMATAVVTGVVAQMLDANRSIREPDGSLMARLNPYAVKALLQYTATHLANTDALAQGAGEVNPAGAIALMRALDTRVEPWTIGAVTPSTTFGGRAQVWSTNIVWGTSLLFADDNIVWGTSSLWDDNIVWGTSADDNIVWGTSDDNIVWGTSVLWDDNIVWGTNCFWDDNIVWGTNVLWDDNIVWGTSDVDDNIVWGTFSQLDGK
jgi:serine protease AprX